jgi:hypothetical protein
MKSQQLPLIPAEPNPDIIIDIPVNTLANYVETEGSKVG